MAALPDGILVSRCLSGDPAAWKELVRIHTPFLASRISRAAAVRGLALPPMELDEVVAATWEAILQDDMRRLRLYRPEASFERWISTVTVFQWRARIRENRRQWTLLRNASAFQRPPEALRSAAPLAGEQAENENRLRAALEKLPPRERFALRSFYWLDWPHGRIASILRIPVNHVGPLLQAARKRLQTLLKNPSGFCL